MFCTSPYVTPQNPESILGMWFNVVIIITLTQILYTVDLLLKVNLVVFTLSMKYNSCSCVFCVFLITVVQLS